MFLDDLLRAGVGPKYCPSSTRLDTVLFSVYTIAGSLSAFADDAL